MALSGMVMVCAVGLATNSVISPSLWMFTSPGKASSFPPPVTIGIKNPCSDAIGPTNLSVVKWRGLVEEDC